MGLDESWIKVLNIRCEDICEFEEPPYAGLVDQKHAKTLGHGFKNLDDSKCIFDELKKVNQELNTD